MLYKPLATMLLVQEMFRQQRGHIRFRIGEVVPLSAFDGDQLSLAQRAKRFRRHVYKLGQGRPGVLKTQRPIARAELKVTLKKALEACELLGETSDGKQIYLYRYSGNSPILREIGRLREIAGAYRLGDAKQIVATHGLEGLYSATLFDYHRERIQPFIESGLELGRSFVQPKYWGKRSLDYLWQGIGALLQRHPQYRYLFGPVTMSASLPTVAHDAMVQFFSEHFPDPDQLASSRVPYMPTSRPLPTKTDDYSADLQHLKHFLAHQGAAIPTLYKQYADFGNAIDGLVMIDIKQLKAHKRARYLT